MIPLTRIPEKCKLIYTGRKQANAACERGDLRAVVLSRGGLLLLRERGKDHKGA